MRSFTLLDPITGREFQFGLLSPRFWRLYNNYYNIDQNFVQNVTKTTQNDTEKTTTTTTTTTKSPKLGIAILPREAGVLPTFSSPKKDSIDAKNVAVVGTGREYFGQDGTTPIYKIKQRNPYGR